MLVECLEIVTCFIENIQSVEVVEESRLLETELNGEIHIISFIMEFYKITNKTCFSQCKITSRIY